MLTYELLKNHAGILLCGDYLTLRKLHDVIGRLDESVIFKGQDNPLMGLAYDVRKAYEGQRKTIHPSEHFPEAGDLFGVEILWPVILTQSRMLRVAMAYMETDKWSQAMAYSLEAVLDEAIESACGRDAAAVKTAWNRIDPAHPFVAEKLHGRGALFSSWSKADRKKRLAGLLQSLDPMYGSHYKMLVDAGVGNLISPDELDEWDGAEYQDPNW